MFKISVLPLLAIAMVGCTNESNLGAASSVAPEAATVARHRCGLGGSGTGEVVVEDLVFLREEEKLARDVYITLYAEHGLAIFDNISESEQRHMDAVLRLLEARDIPDPVLDDAVGVFQNEVLAGLYTDLVDLGMESALGALTVGATIEDLDLHDLMEMAERTTAGDVLRVYESLTCGSRNHMRAFYGQLVAMGGTYEAQYITAAELEEILAGDHERCGRRGR